MPCTRYNTTTDDNYNTATDYDNYDSADDDYNTATDYDNYDSADDNNYNTATDYDNYDSADDYDNADADNITRRRRDVFPMPNVSWSWRTV